MRTFQLFSKDRRILKAVHSEKEKRKIEKKKWKFVISYFRLEIKKYIKMPRLFKTFRKKTYCNICKV